MFIEMLGNIVTRFPLSSSCSRRCSTTIGAGWWSLWCLLYTGLDGCVFPNHLAFKKPAYRSVLDLVPRVSERVSAWITTSAVRGPDALRNLDASNIEFFELAVQFPLGITLRNALDPLSIAVLQEIDGKRSGHAIMRRMVRGGELAPATASGTLITALGHLRRLSILSFAEASR